MVVWPRSVYEDRYVEPIYVTEPFVEQMVVGQPVIETTSSPDYWGFEGAALLPPAATAPQSDLTAPMEAGDEAFRAGDYDEARRHYIRAQLDGPYAGEATLAYALVHFAEGNYQLSALALRRGLEAVPDAVLEPIDVAWLYGETGALGRHLGSLEAYLGEWPTDHAGWFLLGYVRFGAGDPTGAAEAFDRAAALAPGEGLYRLLLEAAQTVMSMPLPPGGDGGLSLAPPGSGTPLYAMWPEVPG
jgi:tetratricopeptide (TPR) repeat protein